MVVLNGQASPWASTEGGVPQGSMLGPLLLSIYIDLLSEDLPTTVKLFADDTFLFSILQNINIYSDLSKTSNQTFQWEMNFDLDPREQTQDVTFYHKIQKT